jgi:DnaJ-class molecular chaperone
LSVYVTNDMKDYYQILGVPENASQPEIKRAFRKQAFKCHPDKNPGNEKQAEAKFKEINEAYGVLGDENRRRQYDLARKGQYAGTGYGSFQYAQQDIFRDTFANQAMFNDLSRMFAQAGLRFDEDFLNRVFFEGRGFVFQVFPTAGGAGRRAYYQPFTSGERPARKPGFIERLLSRLAAKTGRFILGRLLGGETRQVTPPGLDQHQDIEISAREAASGGEKRVTYKRGMESKKLMVKIPPGVKTGTKIRLKGMGKAGSNNSGDLYLHVKVKG